MKSLFDPQTLINFRQTQHWTQEDLSAASGVSTRTIQRIEREGGGSLETWKALASAFDTTLDQFCVIQTESQYSQSDKRKAMFGVSIGCAGGLIGCAVSWWSLSQVPAGALNVYPVLTVYVSFATAVCFIVPIWTYRRLKK